MWPNSQTGLCVKTVKTALDSHYRSQSWQSKLFTFSYYYYYYYYYNEFQHAPGIAMYGKGIFVGQQVFHITGPLSGEPAAGHESGQEELPVLRGGSVRRGAG